MCVCMCVFDSPARLCVLSLLFLKIKIVVVFVFVVRCVRKLLRDCWGRYIGFFRPAVRVDAAVQ